MVKKAEYGVNKVKVGGWVHPRLAKKLKALAKKNKQSLGQLIEAMADVYQV